MFLGKDEEIRECIVQDLSDGFLRFRIVETLFRYDQNDSHQKDYVKHTMDFSLSNVGAEMIMSVPLTNKEFVQNMIKALQNIESRIEKPHPLSPLLTTPTVEITDGKCSK